MSMTQETILHMNKKAFIDFIVKIISDARYVKKIFEQVLQIQADRVAVLPSVTTEIPLLIKRKDIELL